MKSANLVNDTESGDDWENPPDGHDDPGEGITNTKKSDTDQEAKRRPREDFATGKDVIHVLNRGSALAP